MSGLLLHLWSPDARKPAFTPQESCAYPWPVTDCFHCAGTSSGSRGTGHNDTITGPDGRAAGILARRARPRTMDGRFRIHSRPTIPLSARDGMKIILRSTSGFLGLPDEVIVNILKRLSLRCIHACQCACRRLAEIVRHSLALQYNIELEAAGFVAGSPGPLTTAQCMHLLQQRQHQWRTLRWSRKDFFPYTIDDCLTYELNGRVFGQGKGEKGGATTKSISICELPSSYLMAPRRYTIDCLQLGIPVWDFTVDPTQDLLVLIEQMPETAVTLDVHVFSISRDRKVAEESSRRRSRKPRHAATFELPEPTYSDWWNYSVSCLSNCTSRDFNVPAEQRAFRNSRENHILAFCFTGHPHRATLVVQAKTLLHYAAGDKRTVPWAVWGNACTTRWITECCDRDWLCGTHGTRFATLVPSPHGERPVHHCVRVLDFNPFEVRRWPEYQTPWSSTRVVLGEAILPPGGLWKESVSGSLPYREVTLREPMALSGVMIDECGIVCVKVVVTPTLLLRANFPQSASHNGAASLAILTM
ncbi:hypothetical protein AURDEDRAFT_121054 [Auricularia subglabra TFB-10046 SS5]|nr:hypothetical protein AURDEDRAFT_121054 [Auricularia subglabra TFB-10046 SS5]